MYIVNDGNYNLKTIDDVKEFLEENVGVWLDSNSFDEFLDEAYDEVEILGTEYPLSDVYRKVDPVSYDIAERAYIENLISDFVYELKNTGEVDVYSQYKITEKED